jgi:hypothetical protein
MPAAPTASPGVSLAASAVLRAGVCSRACGPDGNRHRTDLPELVGALDDDVLRQQLDAGEMPEKGDEILDCLQAGMDYQKTAVELGISAEAVRKRLLRMRKLFETRLATLGITVMAVMFMMGCAAPAMAANSAEPTAPGPTVTLPPPRQTLQTFAA